MLSILALAISFLLGGVLFLPLLLATLTGFIFYTSPVVAPFSRSCPPLPLPTDSEDDVEPVKIYRAGWLTVRRTYEPLEGSNEGTYVSMMVSGYRSFMDNRSRDPRRSKPKDHFFAVLKQNVLFLYDGEDQVECWAAVEVTLHEVMIYPEGLIDGELFVKRNTICLRPKTDGSSTAKDSEVQEKKEGREKDDLISKEHYASEEKTHDMEPGRPLPWFIFTKVNSDKEDWYFSLVQASKLSSATTATTFAKDRALFDPDDMARLIQGIDEQPESIPVRWLNALLGRIFLAVYRTESLESYITSKIVKKLKRVKTPSILSEVQVREVNVGSAVPFFSKPMLKELTTEGDASIEVHMSYVGDLRMTIATVATINLGSRFKPYSVRLVLAIVLKEIEGTLLIKVKAPPSNRLWTGFTVMPRLVLSVEPVVSTRQIKWSMITSPIESKIREVIMESIVLPHMDDFPFHDSTGFFHRGGIFGEALRKEADLHTPGDGSDAIGHDEEEESSPETMMHATEEEGSGTERKRRARRSSDGDLNKPAASSSSKRDSNEDGLSTSSSSTTLAAFSLSAWASREGKLKEGKDEKRKSWFSPTRSQSPSHSSSSLTPTNHNDPTKSSTDHAESTAIASSRLRDILKSDTDRSTSSTHPDSTSESVSISRPASSALSLTAPTTASLSHHQISSDADVQLGYNSDVVPIGKLPRLSASADNLPLDPASIPLPDSKSPSFVDARPHLPSRPSFTKASSSTLLPPPPRRTVAHEASASIGTASSLISAWRTKATDKEALAAGVAQAKDTMKRWGATWQAARRPTTTTTTEDRSTSGGESSGGERGRRVSTAPDFGEPRSESEGRRSESYREHRASKEKTAQSKVASTSAGEATSREGSIRSTTSTTAPISIIRRGSLSTSTAGHFLPAVSPPTTKVSTTGISEVVSTSGGRVVSPSSPPNTRTYARQSKMAIPGIRDTVRKQTVAEDHAGSNGVEPAATVVVASAEKEQMAEAPKEEEIVPVVVEQVNPSEE